MMENWSDKCVLVVDDSNLNRAIIVEFLKSKGFKILEAADGKEALEIIREQKIDLILLDLIMPVMSGLEMLRTLRQDKNQNERSLLVKMFWLRHCQSVFFVK